MLACDELCTSSSQHPVVRFYGVYYKDIYDNGLNVVTSGSGNQISSVSAYVFPLSHGECHTKRRGTIPYVGGTKVPVLIE